MCVVRLPRNRIARTLLLLVALPAVVGAVLGLGLAAAFKVGGVSADGPVHPWFTTRSRLKPIPIPQRACPYLDVVRKTAAAAGNSSIAVLGSKASKHTKAEAYARLPDELAAFGFALRIAADQVPKHLAEKLGDVARNVEHGRRLRSVSLDAREYALDSMIPLADGYFAMGDADALVRDACGFDLLDASAGVP